jgi:hypothetical protein
LAGNIGIFILPLDCGFCSETAERVWAVLHRLNVVEALLRFLKSIEEKNHPLLFGSERFVRPTLRLFRHFPPQLGEMQESETDIRISRSQRGALAFQSFSAAQPNGRGLGGRSVQVSHGVICLNKASDK